MSETSVELGVGSAPPKLHNCCAWEKGKNHKCYQRGVAEAVQTQFLFFPDTQIGPTSHS